jgi:carbonic anhydrase/acetyltransferase-like protein (isoleucine patch superfamily)
MYDNYLEPFSMNRVACQLNFFGKVPNWNDADLYTAAEYIGETATLIGNVVVSNASVVMEGVTANGGLNDIYIGEGTQVLENVCMVGDQPTTLHHYQRDEAINPYQTMEMTEGIVRIGPNCIIEPNVLLESCQIGACSRIGHNSKIFKGTNIGILCIVMPGTVVVADTNIPDGELWGGAPAHKLGKVSKFEWKRPYYPSVVHKELLIHVYSDMSRYGDQVVEFAHHQDTLETLVVEFEAEVPEGVRAKVREAIEGREPFHHMVARITQGWVPTNRADDKCGDHLIPCIATNYHSRHNDDATGGRYAGTPLQSGGLAVVKNQR